MTDAAVMSAVPGRKPDLVVRRPFTRADAVAHGITDRELRGPRFKSLFRSIHIAADVELTPLLWAEAALLAFPGGAHASHATAARLYRLPIPTIGSEHVTVPDARLRRRREGIRCDVRAEARVRIVDGLPVSAPEQVFLDLAADLSLVELVVVGDHLVRKGLVRLKQLRAFCASSSGRGAAQARAAAAYVRERVDSPMETRLRMLIVLAGLPEPQVNLTFGDDDGLQLRRYDLCWPEVRLIVEYDGRHHIEREAQWVADLDRRERIEDDAWRIIVLTARDVYATPGRTIERIHRLLRDRGMPGTPTRPAHGWQQHFPGRG